MSQDAAPEAQPEQAPSQEAPQAPETPQEPKADELPDWARQSLEKANKEAASYRAQLREAQKALGDAKTPEEFEKVVGDLNTKLLEAERRLTIRDNTEGLPKELIEAPWVNWPGDEEGIKAVADQLRALVAKQEAEKQAPPTTGGTLAGGLNPGAPTFDQMDPQAWGKRLRQRHR